MVALMVLSPVVGAVGAGAGTLLTRRERRASRRVREAFRRFVPEAVVDEVLSRTDDQLRLGGSETYGTVMFTDVRGFTTFSEARPACDVIAVLNRYLTEMSDAILDHGGTLVSYSGDGIMAVFGAPVEQDDHADRAPATALAILDDHLPRFNAWLADQGVLDGFRIGVGLNSGSFVSGNVGSERRLEYTAIGDTINAAARLEALTKGTPHSLFLSDATRLSLRGPRDDLVYVGERELRGRAEAVDAWTVRGVRATEGVDVSSSAVPT
jgi:adenylate cyclase